MSMWNLEPGLGHLQWVNRFHFVIRSLVRFSALSCLLIEWACCCCSLHCWNLLFCVRDVHNVCTSSQTCLFSNHRICGSFGHPCTLWRLFLNYCVVVRGEQKWRRQCCNLLHSEQIACPCHKLHQCWKKKCTRLDSWHQSQLFFRRKFSCYAMAIAHIWWANTKGTLGTG